MLTPEDLEQIAGIVDASEPRTGEAIDASERRTGEAISAAERRSGEAIAKAKEETIEAMRDMQTETLKGIEAFARGNFARMHRLETSAAATVEQLAALEERVLRLETRQRPTP